MLTDYTHQRSLILKLGRAILQCLSGLKGEMKTDNPTSLQLKVDSSSSVDAYTVIRRYEEQDHNFPLFVH